jgi:hypothetical protein
VIPETVFAHPSRGATCDFLSERRDRSREGGRREPFERLAARHTGEAGATLTSDDSPLGRYRADALERRESSRNRSL